jgi:hypothetical protein
MLSTSLRTFVHYLFPSSSLKEQLPHLLYFVGSTPQKNGCHTRVRELSHRCQHSFKVLTFRSTALAFGGDLSSTLVQRFARSRLRTCLLLWGCKFVGNWLTGEHILTSVSFCWSLPSWSLSDSSGPSSLLCARQHQYWNSGDWSADLLWGWLQSAVPGWRMKVAGTSSYPCRCALFVV